jgi:hypothetical protein
VAKQIDRSKTHKWVWENIRLEDHDYKYSLDGLLEKLIEIKSSIPENAEEQDITVGADYYHSDYDSVETHINVNVKYWRPLTEEELKQRDELSKAVAKGKREAAKKRKQEKEAKEREEYEWLRKKFETSS